MRVFIVCMKINKKKNGFKITVKEWDNVVTISNEKTGKIIKREVFSDHIKACMVASAL